MQGAAFQMPCDLRRPAQGMSGGKCLFQRGGCPSSIVEAGEKPRHPGPWRSSGRSSAEEPSPARVRLSSPATLMETAVSGTAMMAPNMPPKTAPRRARKGMQVEGLAVGHRLHRVLEHGMDEYRQLQHHQPRRQPLCRQGDDHREGPSQVPAERGYVTGDEADRAYGPHEGEAEDERTATLRAVSKAAMMVVPLK